jgi:PEP-CTERM motif
MEIPNAMMGPGKLKLIVSAGEKKPSLTLSFFDPFPGVSTGQFVGFISDTPFSAVTLAAPGGFTYTLDDLNFVPVAVPGPATLILVGAGVAGAASWRRSRRG